MESWRTVWRRGFSKVLSTPGLAALRAALETDDPRLVQGATTKPPPLECVKDWPVEAADAIGFCGWQGDGLKTVIEVEEHFAKACFDADQLLLEPAACRFWLNFWDDAPRDEAFRDLLAEVVRELEMRQYETEVVR